MIFPFGPLSEGAVSEADWGCVEGRSLDDIDCLLRRRNKMKLSILGTGKIVHDAPDAHNEGPALRCPSG